MNLAKLVGRLEDGQRLFKVRLFVTFILVDRSASIAARDGFFLDTVFYFARDPKQARCRQNNDLREIDEICGS